MNTELVSVTTPEGIVLSGAYFAAQGASPPGLDAMVFFHGDGGNFYAPLYLGLGQFLAGAGITCLVANRRGHDLVSHGAKGGPLAGYAFESVSHARVDYRCWLDLLAARGLRRVALGGHSGGAVRAVYAQAMEKFAETVALVSISPGEYHHETVVEVHSDAFKSAYETATRNVQSGHPDALNVPGIPWGSMWSAAAYVDCFNTDNRYSVSHHATQVECPTLFVFGAKECGGDEILPVCSAACARLRQAGLAHVRVDVIANANHGYEHEEHQLYETVTSWLSRGFSN